MSIIAWIILGLIAGFIASKIKAERKLPSFINVPLGMMGAIVGACLFDGVQITDLRR